MAVTRSAAKKSVPVDRNTSQLSMFVWEGTDKRGVKMKGEQQSKNMNLLRADAERGWYELSPFQSYDGIKGRTSSGLILDARVAHQQILQMDNDARSIIDGTPMRVPGEEGLRDMRVVDAIFRSVAEEGRVKIG